MNTKRDIDRLTETLECFETVLALAHERSCEADLAATLVEPMATGSRAAIGAKRARNGARSGTPGARIGCGSSRRQS